MKNLMKKIAVILTISFLAISVSWGQELVITVSQNGVDWYDDYKNANINGVYGDELYLKVANTFSDGTSVPEGTQLVWSWDENGIILTDSLYLDESLIVMVKSGSVSFGVNNPSQDYDTGLMSIYPKFNPSELIIESEDNNGSKDGENSVTLKVSDFSIDIHQSLSNYLSWTGVLKWYKEEEEEELQTDTVKSSGEDYSIDNVSFTVDTTGVYYIKLAVTYLNTYGADSVPFVRTYESGTLQIGGLTAIEFDKISKLVIYPNPTTDYLYVSNSVDYTIYSMAGVEVLKGYGDFVDVSQLSKGNYIFKTSNEIFRFVVH